MTKKTKNAEFCKVNDDPLEFEWRKPDYFNMQNEFSYLFTIQFTMYLRVDNMVTNNVKSKETANA